MPARALAACMLLLVGGCHASRTEMVVQVAVNGLSIPGDIDSLRLVVTDRGAETWSLPQTPFCPAGRSPTKSPPECLSLPLVATLFPGPKQPQDPVEVEVIAYAGASKVIDDAATFTFAYGQSLELVFVLSPKCLHSDCAHDAEPHSCFDDGGCAKLEPRPLGSEPPLDDGGGGGDGGAAAGSGIVKAQASSVVQGGNGNLSISLPSTTAGNLLVATFVVCGNGLQTNWTSLGLAPQCGSVPTGFMMPPVACSAHVAYEAATGGSVTFSATYGSNGIALGMVSEWSGVTGTPPIDAMGQATTGNAGDLTVSTGGPTSFAGELGLDVVCEVRAQSGGWGPGPPAGGGPIDHGSGWTTLGMDSAYSLSFATDFRPDLPAAATASEHVMSGATGSWAAALVTIH